MATVSSMDITKRVEVLAHAPIFRGLSEEILGRIARVAEEIVVAADETFIVEDEVEPWMYLMVEGSARVHREDLTIATVTPGATVGELAVLDPAPRSASVTAVEDSRLLRIEHAYLAELMAEEPELSDGIIAMLVRLIRANSEQIEHGPVRAV